MLSKLTDRNGGRWIVKRKFGMALLCLVGAFVIAMNVKSGLGEWTAFCTMLLGMIFAADITDKKLNGGRYDAVSKD